LHAQVSAVSADASDSHKPSEPTVGRVSVGGYRLLLGDPSGATIVPSDTDAELSPLAHALAEESGQPGSAPNAVDRLEGAVVDASQVTGKVERAATLFKEISQRRLDPASVSNEVDALVGLLRKLDREERFEEVLRVAHSLAMLLGLIERWLELLRSLESALSAAERLGDTASKAWALHELGTLNLAAGRDVPADRMLSEAHHLRREGDTHALEITEHNLQVLCRKLRMRLHDKPKRSFLEWLVHKPAVAFIFAALLLLAGGVAGAATGGSRNAADTVSNSSSPGGKSDTGDGKSTQSDNTTTGKTTTGKTATGKTTTGNTTGPSPAKPSIGSANTTTFEEGAEGRFIVTATGTPTPTITMTGKLPRGVTFNGSVLAGIPTTNGSFRPTFTATNSAGSASQSFVLTVTPRPTTTSEETTTVG
jgi:hypothetical protein